MTFLLQAAADRLLQLGYFPRCRVQKGKNDAGFRCRIPSPDRAEAKRHQRTSAWPRKLQMRCPSLAQEAWRSSRSFWATTSSCICRFANCRSRAASRASWSLSLVSRASALSSRVRWLRLVSRVLRASSSRPRVMSSSSSRSYRSPSSFSTSSSRWLTWRACTARSSSCLVTTLA
jgi:hypothetical protein